MTILKLNIIIFGLKIFIIRLKLIIVWGFMMLGVHGDGDLKAGFYYDLKIVVVLLYAVFVIVSVVVLGLGALADFVAISLLFVVLLFYLDLQETIEVQVPRYGWKCSKKDYRLASALLIISLFLIPIGNFLLTSGIAAKHPLSFLLSLMLLSAPFILGMAFALSCYMDFGRSPGWKKDKEIIKVFQEHSYFHRKIHGLKYKVKTKRAE